MFFNQDHTEIDRNSQHLDRHSNVQYEREFLGENKIVVYFFVYIYEEKNEIQIYSNWGERLQWSY